MTSPVTRHPGQAPWQLKDGQLLDRYTLVLAATGLWMLLLLIGLVLTFG